MNQQALLRDIQNYRNFVVQANHGSELDRLQIERILDWAKTREGAIKTLENITELPHRNEAFQVVHQDGNPVRLEGNEVYFPRWICHLLGIRHRTTHAILTMPNGMLVIQRRSREKDDSPGAFDISVGGHVKGTKSFRETLLEEMEEELGIRESDTLLITKVTTYESKEYYPDRNFHDAEVRGLFEVQFTPGALDRIRFSDREVAAMYLCGAEEASELLTKDYIASGLKYSLPVYLAWKFSRQAPVFLRQMRSIYQNIKVAYQTEPEGFHQLIQLEQIDENIEAISECFDRLSSTNDRPNS